jgi:hypothetical protein
LVRLGQLRLSISSVSYCEIANALIERFSIHCEGAFLDCGRITPYSDLTHQQDV